MTSKQSGFTLIELIAVLVILGILAATAVPRFINLSDEAQDAAVASLAGSLESASALNHAVDIANEAGLTSDTFYNIANCTDAEGLLTKNLDAKYVIAAGAVGDQQTAECTLNVYPLTSGGAADTSASVITSATFAVIGAAGGSAIP